MDRNQAFRGGTGGGFVGVGVGRLPREGAGAKKFGMSLEAQGRQTFLRDIPGFWLGYLGGFRRPQRRIS